MMKTSLIKLISLLSLASLSCNVLAQASPNLSSPASMYRVIEEMAIKNMASPSTNPIELIRKEPTEQQTALAKNHMASDGTIALMLIDKGRIVFEGYQGPTESNRLVSMSMGKSILSLLVGEALCSNKIDSLDDPAEKYAPELEGKYLGKASIRQLLTMTSGVKSPDSTHGQPYYRSSHYLLIRTESMKNIITKYDNNDSRSIFGNIWTYNNLNTDALYFVINKVSNKNFIGFYKSTIVENAGLNSATYWALDSSGNEITHSFYFATLQDWARLALYIRDHLLHKQNTCMGKYIKEATSNNVFARSSEFNNYGYQFFVNSKTGYKNDFWMVGFAGQRIAFNMKDDKIVINFSWKLNVESTHTLFNKF